MRKNYVVFLILMLIFMFSSSVFASCNLDTTRWKWINSDNKVGLYYDTKTIKKINNYLIECWICSYYPNDCDVHFYEHYHYDLARIDYYSDSYGIKTHVVRDSNGKIVDNDNYHYIDYQPILPNSIGEAIAMGIKNDYGL